MNLQKPVINFIKNKIKNNNNLKIIQIICSIRVKSEYLFL
jgi:hypothetical protein